MTTPPFSRPTLLMILAASLLLGGCAEDTPLNDLEGAYDADAVIEHVGTNVIAATYANLDARAAELQAAIDALRSDPTPENLAAARDAWRAARRPWEQSEGFLFGPVSTKGIDPAIDSWPLNKPSLNDILASDQQITEAFVANQDGTLKGFHAIEYLLFGSSGEKPVGEITEREFAYLAAAAAALKDRTAQLAAAWDPSAEGNYLETFLSAGAQGNATFQSKGQAIAQLAEGLFIIADEVGTGKIGGPFSTADTDPQEAVRNVESRFSRNSISDFTNNVRSVWHVYTGAYDGQDGPGLSAFVAEAAPELDAQIRSEIQAAIDAIQAIPPPFRAAITEHREAVRQAQEAVLKLRDTVEQELLPLVRSSTFE